MNNHHHGQAPAGPAAIPERRRNCPVVNCKKDTEEETHMNKKVLALVLVCTMILGAFSISYAIGTDGNKASAAKGSGTVTETSQTLENMSFSLEQAMDYALEHSQDIAIQDAEIDAAEMEYKEAQNELYKARAAVRREEGTYPTNLQYERGVMERSNELIKDRAYWNKDIAMNAIRYDVQSAYADLLLANKSVEIAQEGLNLSQTLYDQGQVMYKVGTISKQDLLDIELALYQSQTSVDSAKMAYDMQLMSFNDTLGLPLETKIQLTDDITYQEYEDIDLSAAIKEASETNKSLYVLQENLDLQKINLEITEVQYPDNTFEYRTAAVAIPKAEKSLESVKTQLEMGVRSAYLQLLNAEKQIKTAQKSVEIAQNSYDMVQVSFKVGQSKSTDVTQAQIELMNSKTNLNQQIHAYNQALLDFQYSKGIGTNQL